MEAMYSAEYGIALMEEIHSNAAYMDFFGSLLTLFLIIVFQCVDTNGE